jgi:hypothetical protein
MVWVKRAFDKLKKIREMFWSGRPDLNRGPPAPKAGVRRHKNVILIAMNGGKMRTKRE